MYVGLKQKQQQLQNEIKSAQEYKDKIEYIGHVREVYNRRAWMISDRGYEVILGGGGMYRRIMIMLTLICGIMMISSESGSLEYRSGMILLEKKFSVWKKENQKKTVYS